MIFYGSFFQTAMFDTKTNLLTFVDVKIWTKNTKKHQNFKKLPRHDDFWAVNRSSHHL